MEKKIGASASVEIAKQTLMSGGLILAIGTITGLLAQKIKIPDVALFLIVGMLIGPEAMGLVDIKADSAPRMIASVTFIAILMTILIQPPTTKWLGNKLGLLQENKRR